MTPAELKTLLTNIEGELEGVATFAGTLDPALIPIIAIGKAVARQIPGLAEGVANWVEGNPPSDADISDLHAKLSALGDPNSP